MQSKIQKDADKWRIKLSKEAVKALMDELQGIPDEKLVNAVSRNVKLKINII